MTFNTNKCYSMHIMISKMRKNHVSVPYQMNGTELERVTNTKYLGATISENLSWKIHNERAAHGTISLSTAKISGCSQNASERKLT